MKVALKSIVAHVLTLYAGYLLVADIFIMGFVLLGTILIWLYIQSVRYNGQPLLKEDDVYTELRKYVKEKCPDAEILIGGSRKCFNGSTIGKNIIYISRGWYCLCKENRTNIEYVKATICHEIYHLTYEKHSAWEMIKDFWLLLYCPSERMYVKHCILLWLEEFKADKHGCFLYGDRKKFIEKMHFMKDMERNEVKRIISTHPKWDIRIKFIEENIDPVWERAEEAFGYNR